MGPTSTLNFTWPSLGRSMFGGGISSPRMEAEARVLPSWEVHSALLWLREKERRIGRGSVGERPERRRGVEERAVERRKFSSGVDRVLLSGRGRM